MAYFMFSRFDYLESSFEYFNTFKIQFDSLVIGFV
jgi:hypothetical protein